MEAKRKYTLALGQFASQHGDTAANLRTMRSLVRQAAAKGAELIVFPELAYTGHLCRAAVMRTLAESQDGVFVRALQEEARANSIHIVAGYPEVGEEAGTVYNSAVLIDNTGTVLENMRKVYLWGKEKRTFTPGRRFPVADTPLGRIGLLICYDAEFPEPARIEALKGAELLVVCSIWSAQPAEHRWHVDMQAAALYNLVFVAGCNAVGENICGSSMLVGPDGEERAVASRTDEALLLCEVDLDEIPATREKIPYFADYKKETFSADAPARF